MENHILHKTDPSMATNEVSLLNFWPSPFGARAKIALALKGIDYEYKEEEVMKSKSDLLLKMNPIHQKIPVLIHNGKPICESFIILEYIDEVWNDNSPLLPQDPYKRATARFWADFIDKKMFEVGKKVWTTKGEELEGAKKEFLDYLKLVEGELGDKPYFGGESFGYLDVVFLPYYGWFHPYESCGNFSVEVECPKLVAWAKRCLEKESVVKSLPDPMKIFEFFTQMRKSMGLE